ncbi:hypothetical protein MRX96_016806 [Rhipicephalus microplus]
MRNTTASALSDYAQLLSRLEHQHKTFENTIVHPQKSSPQPWRSRRRDRKCSKTGAQITNSLPTLKFCTCANSVGAVSAENMCTEHEDFTQRLIVVPAHTAKEQTACTKKVKVYH